MSDVLPSGWSKSTLGTLTEYVTSGSRDWSRYYAPTGALFIRTQDINKNRVAEVDSIARVSLPPTVEGKRSLVLQGDLLVTITGANVGRCAHVLTPLPEAYVSQSVALVRLRLTSIARFVHYQLLAPWPGGERTWLEANAYGMGRPVLSLENVRGAPIHLAPLGEQQRIADKLDTVLARVDACRDRLARVTPLLKRFRQSVLAAGASGELARDIREQATADRLHLPTVPDSGVWANAKLPGGWEIRGFSECFTDLTDSTRKLPQKLYQPSGAAPVVDQGSVLIGGYTDDVSLLCRERPPLIVFGDHTRCVKWIDFPFVQGADGVKVLKAKGIEPKFAYLLLLAIELPDKGYSRHFKFLRNSVFPVPPHPEQVEIVRRVETLFAFADRLEARLAQAQTTVDRLTPSLLAKAFRGELVPQDPADEPAAELLRRLAASRTATTAKTRKPRQGQPA